MDSQIVTPFIEAVSELMSSMVGISCSLTPISEVEPSPYVSGIITLSGAAHGQVALSLSHEAGTELVARMLGMEAEEVDDDILGDGVGEMANIVAGSAKAKMATMGLGYQLSLPSIVTGSRHHLSLFKSEEVRHYRMHSELGSLALSLWLAAGRGALGTADTDKADARAR